jgi:hypothetical protein
MTVTSRRGEVALRHENFDPCFSGVDIAADGWLQSIQSSASEESSVPAVCSGAVAAERDDGRSLDWIFCARYENGSAMPNIRQVRTGEIQ